MADRDVNQEERPMHYGDSQVPTIGGLMSRGEMINITNRNRL